VGSTGYLVFYARDGRWSFHTAKTRSGHSAECREHVALAQRCGFLGVDDSYAQHE